MPLLSKLLLAGAGNSWPHSRGISLYGHGVLFCGDTLLKQSIGRSDLPGGNHQQLIASIKTKLLALPGETVVLTGHGPGSTLAAEAATNPWLQG